MNVITALKQHPHYQIMSKLMNDNGLIATSSDNVIINECNNGDGLASTLPIKVSDNVKINECDNGNGYAASSNNKKYLI